MDASFPPLTLPPDADERAVKRAYAAALKQTRPEDDPVAFQALVNARDRALDWVRRREQPAGSVLASEALQPATAVSSGEPVKPETIDEPDIADDVTEEDAERVLRQILAEVEDQPDALPLDRPIPGPITSDFSVSRASARQRADLILAAIDLIRREADLRKADSDDAWARLIGEGDELDLAGRLSLERVVVVTLDAVLADLADNDADPATRFARTILTLDRAFRWSDDMRRVVRILGEPVSAHPLVFAIERFGERAVRLRVSPSDFPLIPEVDLHAWYGRAGHGGVKAYRRAEERGRFGLGWSWYALLSPPAFLVSIGANITAIGLTASLVVALYLYFDPIANVWQADGFATFLAFLFALRVGFALAARPLEIGSLVRRIRRIEAGGLPPLAERRTRIAAGRGSGLLNMTIGLAFLLLVDGYWLSLIFPALNLSDKMVAEMIVVPDRKVPGVTFADRLTAQSYIDNAREIAKSIDDLLRDAKGANGNPIALARAEALKAQFVARIGRMPIGDFAPDFERFRDAIAAAKRRSYSLATPSSALP